MARQYRYCSPEDRAAGQLPPNEVKRCAYDAQTNPDACVNCPSVCKLRCTLLGEAAQQGNDRLVCADCPCRKAFRYLFFVDNAVYRGADRPAVLPDPSVADYLPDPDSLPAAGRSRGQGGWGGISELEMLAGIGKVTTPTRLAKTQPGRAAPAKAPAVPAKTAKPGKAGFDSRSIVERGLAALGGRATLEELNQWVAAHHSREIGTRSTWKHTLRSWVYRIGLKKGIVAHEDGTVPSVYYLPSYKKPEPAKSGKGGARVSWAKLTVEALKGLGGQAELQDIYAHIRTHHPEAIVGHPNWQDFVRGWINHQREQAKPKVVNVGPKTYALGDLAERSRVA